MKKKLFFGALAVCLIAVIACGSLAYFTDNSTKTNKFMTAAYDPTDPDPDPDDIFSIVVEEKSEKDPSNERSVAGEEREDGTGFDYNDLLPGSMAAKDVVVTNTGKYGAYVRAYITVSKASAWEDIFGEGENLAEKLADVDTTNWTLVDSSDKDDTVTYTYYYATDATTGTVLAAGTSTTSIITTVTIPETLTTEQFFTVDGFEVSIKAEAIQSDYTGTIDEAFGFYK